MLFSPHADPPIIKAYRPYLPLSFAVNLQNRVALTNISTTISLTKPKLREKTETSASIEAGANPWDPTSPMYYPNNEEHGKANGK